MYKIIDEKLGIASCSLSDLTMQQIARLLDQWDHDSKIGGLALFYDEDQDLLVLNRDHKFYEEYLKFSTYYLETDACDKDFSSKAFQDASLVLDDCKRKRYARKEMDIVMHQTGNVFAEDKTECVLSEIYSHGMKYAGDMKWAISLAYSYGVIQGVRKERARRKK